MFKEILLLGVLASGSSLWQQCECDAMEVLVSITIPTCYIYVIYIPSTTLQLVVLLLQTFVHLSTCLYTYLSLFRAYLVSDAYFFYLGETYFSIASAYIAFAEFRAPKVMYQILL